MKPVPPRSKEQSSIQNESRKRKRADLVCEGSCEEKGPKKIRQSLPSDNHKGKGKAKRQDDAETQETGVQNSRETLKAEKINLAPRKRPKRPRSTQVVKLNPPRPFPMVPTSSTATGPRSSRAEGNNMICVTRKVELGMYLRRCKDLILRNGYKTLQLHAMGAAIPLLLTLTTSLPLILPYSSNEIHTEYKTGTVQTVDEVFYEDEDVEDNDNAFKGDLQRRNRSSMMVIFKIGDGEREPSGRVKQTGSTRKKGEDAKIVSDDLENRSSDSDI
ncbi:hypothetical protein FRC03_000027 [Tulasnella sp. 419]|nr:hypothetical protein FRC02_010643 [Tulasnella sp. 418]KAG8970810.1 hypothetical protein FRC03_000027 [Tulasnella sp. 419]